MNFKIDGLDNIQKEIEKIINGNVQLEELLTKEFLQENTNFNSIQEFLDASKSVLSNDENSIIIIDYKMDLFVAENTKYSSWKEIKQAAGNMYATKKLREHGFDAE